MKTRRFGAPALVGVAVVALLAAAPAAAASKGSTPPRPTNSFATGTVAALSGSTMEVQSTTGQTTVTVSGTTTFAQILSETPSAIAVGDCVRATGTGSTTRGIKASSISLSKPTSSGCALGLSGGAGAGPFVGPGRAGGFRGRFGGGTGGAEGGTRPTFPTGGRRPGSFGNLGTATGSVTAVKGDVVTVKARVPKTTKPSKSRKPLKFVTRSVKVTVGGSAAVTTTSSATAAALANGVCVSAIGPADTTGAIMARSITISQPVNGSCSSGFGGGFGRFGGGFGGAGPGAGRSGGSAST